MIKKEFNPYEWANKKGAIEQKNECSYNLISISNNTVNIESLIQEIEKNKIDITHGYCNWRDIGFALADEFNEGGREYFHRISKFNNSYNVKNCNEQFTSCLNSNGSGITIKTFFYKCKLFGIYYLEDNVKEIEDIKDEKVNGKAYLLPDPIFPLLPQFLKNVVSVSKSNEERDLLLLGAIVTLSCCFPKIHGIYDGITVYSNLFLFITAPASAGKGRLILCKKLVQPIHKSKREESIQLRKKYDAELKEFNIKKKKDFNLIKPIPPPEKMLFIPANNSATGAFQLLNDNSGNGLIFETEGDTLAQAFKSDYGNYNDGFRKSFHHENISYFRRTDREYVDIESPRLSCLLTGTPKQISALIPNAENGLFSRFMFYYVNINPKWKNVFEVNHVVNLDDYFENLGNDFFEFYKTLQNSCTIQFKLTIEQEAIFNFTFEELQNTYIAFQDLDYIASVRRLGLIAFRIAMIISALRLFEKGNEISPSLICNDNDFNIAMEIIKTLVKHASTVYNDLPKVEQLLKKKNQKEMFFESLPNSFNRQVYLSIADKLKIPDKTAQGYISKFLNGNLIFRIKQDNYEKKVSK
jgi:hypothetical protein